MGKRGIGRLKKAFAHPHWLFLGLVLFFGTLTAVLHGPVNAADENSHFWRAFLMSEGRFFPGKTGTGLDACRGPIPECMLDLVYNRLWNSPHNRHPLGMTGVTALLRERQTMLSEPYVDEPRLDAALGNASNFGPVCYLPQAGGILLGRMAGAAPLALVYWGRFANLMAYALLVFAAIRLMPKGKYVLFVVALTPMTIIQAASLSADTTTNALAWLLVALLIRAAFGGQNRLSNRALVLLIVVQIALTFSKPAYFCLAFLVFLIPPARFAGRRRHLAFLAAFFGLQTAAILATVQLVNLSFVQPAYADRTAQFLHVLKHPFKYMLTLVLTVGVSLLRQEPAQYETMIGSVGHNPFFSIPTTVIVLFFAAYILAGLAEAPMLRLQRKHRLLIGGVFLISMLQIYTTLYLWWTPVGHYTVYGVHGRAYFPLLPLALMLLPSLRFAERWRTTLRALPVAIVLVGGGSLLWTLLSVFWMPYQSLIADGDLRVRETLPAKSTVWTLPAPEKAWRLACAEEAPPEGAGWEQVLIEEASAHPSAGDFGITLELEKRHRYLLYVHASTSGAVVPECYVWSQDTGNARHFSLLDDEPVLKLRAGRLHQHRYGCFTTGASETIRVTAFPKNGKHGDRIRWHVWALTEN